MDFGPKNHFLPSAQHGNPSDLILHMLEILCAKFHTLTAIPIGLYWSDVMVKKSNYESWKQVIVKFLANDETKMLSDATTCFYVFLIYFGYVILQKHPF